MVAQAYKESQAGGAAGWTPVGYSVANKLVSKAREALGLDRCEFMYLLRGMHVSCNPSI